MTGTELAFVIMASGGLVGFAVGYLITELTPMIGKE